MRVGRWKEAQDTGLRQAVLLMRPIGRLFWIERAMKKRAERLGLDRDAFHDLRRDVRGRLSSRTLGRIDERVEELSGERSTLPKSMLGKALTYLVKEPALLRKS